MHRLVRCKHGRRCWRACEEDVSFTDVKMKIPNRRLTRGCEWHHAPDAHAGGLGDFEKVGLLSLAVRRRRVPFACSQWPCGGCPRDGAGADGKVSIARLCVSFYVEKPFNSKVIKSFVPELRSRKCFSCFGIPVLCIYVIVGYHLTFQHNELFHLPYMAVTDISQRISLQVRPEEPFLLLKYIITLLLILCSYYLQSLSCKYSFR